MKCRARRLASDSRGVVAPIVALSLFGLVAVGGIAFDYSRLATMNTELQDAADQAALAGASQLDGQSGAVSRSVAAARSLLVNISYLANDSCGTSIETGITNTACTTNTSGSIERIYFYPTKADAEADTNGVAASAATDSAARYVKVAVVARKANYALTPIVGALSSGNIGAEAVAGLGSAICKVPPVMVCNPSETSANTNEFLGFNPARGAGLKLITGSADAPGNFGWLETNAGPGANALAGALGYDQIPGDCISADSVTTKPGLSKSVFKPFNTRFDVYENGKNCPNNPGGTCSPSTNTRKDLVCSTTNNTSCKGDFAVSASPYRPTAVAPLPSNGSADPDTMGYPRDLCHAVPIGSQTCGIVGTGNWDRDAYFRVNYGWMTPSAWSTGTGLTSAATRYEVYTWELAHPVVSVSGANRGISVPKLLTGKNAAFSYPATGNPGLTPGGTTVDKRRISIAVLNCYALNTHGRSTGPVAKWLDVFLIEPAWARAGYTQDTEVYGEVIGETVSGGSGPVAAQVVRHDTPYLVK
jgi:Flp pilus assembly protein TadG